MDNPSALKQVDLCSFLGYEKDRPGKNSKDLLRATSAFLKDNESRGLRLPPSSKRTDPVEAQLCAMMFLEEEERAEKFWPATSDGSLTYENDSQVHVFRHLYNLILTYSASSHTSHISFEVKQGPLKS
jgi:hypothetical protein